MSSKKFRTGLFGYNKKDVYEFIEKLAKDMEEQVKEKDGTINNLKSQSEQYKDSIDEVNSKYIKLDKDREFIADAIIRAEEQAKRIIDDAIAQAKREKDAIIGEISIEKEKLRRVKQDLKDLKLYAVSAVKKYEYEIDNVIGEEVVDRKEADKNRRMEINDMEINDMEIKDAKEDELEIENNSSGIQFTGSFTENDGYEQKEEDLLSVDNEEYEENI